MFVASRFDTNVQVGHRPSLSLAHRSIVRKKKIEEDKVFRNCCNDEPRSEIVSDALVIGGGVRSGRAHQHRPTDRLNSQESGEVLSTTHYQRGSVVY